MYKKLHKPKNFSNFREMIYNSARQYKNNIAFHIRDKEKEYRYVTYKDLKEEFRILGNHLLDLGLENKPIAIIGKNSYRWSLHYLVAATVGIVVPIDRELDYSDVVNFIISGECTAVFADPNMVEELQEKLDSSIKVYSLDNPLPDIANEDNRIDLIEVDNEKMTILIFTSGTTGSSKGVCLSQKNILTNIYATSSIVKVTNKDKVMSILPLHHTYECTLDNLMILSRGACISYSDSIARIKNNIMEYKPTMLVVVPALLSVLEKRIQASIVKGAPQRYKKLFENNSIADAMDKLPGIIRGAIKKSVLKGLGGKLHTFIVGAAEVPATTVMNFNALGIRTLQGYGLTETSPLLAGNSDFFFNPKSIGKAIPGVEIIIDDPDDEGVGEILAKGDNIMLGYYKDPEATEAAFKNGYFRTGDLGSMGADGALFFQGRLKNVIVTLNGKNIYPEEIESRLLENEYIGEALVLGFVQDGDSKVKAKIFPNMNLIKERLGYLPTTEEVYEMIKNLVTDLNAKIPNYKQIKIFEILDIELEKTTTNKIMRYGHNML